MVGPPPVRTDTVERANTKTGVVQRLIPNDLFDVLVQFTKPWVQWLNQLRTTANGAEDQSALALLGRVVVAPSTAIQDAIAAQPRAAIQGLAGRVSALEALEAIRQPVIAGSGIPPLQALSTRVAPYPDKRVFLVGTLAGKALKPAAAYDVGSTYLAYETSPETCVLFEVVRDASGAKQWKYIAGQVSGTLSPDQKPTGLGTFDKGLLFEAPAFERVFRWDGAAWERAPGNQEPAGTRLSTDGTENPGSGWQLCDGSTVDVTTAAGGLVSRTVPDYGTAAYAKMGTAASVAPSAAGGATASDVTGISIADHSTANDTDVTGADVRVTTANHVITDPGHTHGPGSLELRNATWKTYYRR